MKKTLVTGASGFTGSALCKRLIQEGEKVVAFVRHTSNREELDSPEIELRFVDIKDRSQVFDNFHDIGTVYHMAAAYRTEHSDVDEFRMVNVEGTRHLLEAAKTARVDRFVHCSTVGVQGEIDDPPASEDYRFKPGDHYQESKLEGELLAKKFLSDGIPGAIVRPVGIYGPGDMRFLKLFKPINRGYYVMIGSGDVLYHMTYVDDLVEGIILCGRKPEALGEVFTIAGEEYTTIRELVNLVAESLGKSPPRLRVPFYPVYIGASICEKICRKISVEPPIYPRRVEFFHKDRAFSIEKAKSLLGYRPKVGLREGLKNTSLWYREKGLI